MESSGICELVRHMWYRMCCSFTTVCRRRAVFDDADVSVQVGPQRGMAFRLPARVHHACAIFAPVTSLAVPHFLFPVVETIRPLDMRELWSPLARPRHASLVSLIS